MKSEPFSDIKFTIKLSMVNKNRSLTQWKNSHCIFPFRGLIVISKIKIPFTGRPAKAWDESHDSDHERLSMPGRLPQYMLYMRINEHDRHNMHPLQIFPYEKQLQRNLQIVVPTARNRPGAAGENRFFL